MCIRDRGKTIILVSHSMNTIKKHCHRAMLLDKGKQIVIGKPERVIHQYRKIATGGPISDKTKLKTSF